ncbi:hypothetical protein ACXET9_07395 [Brachybacterium sp. DNPG3]
MTIKTELDAWLGPVLDDFLPGEYDSFTEAANAYLQQPFRAERDPEDQAANQAEDDAALSAILQHILDEDTLANVVSRYRQAEAELTGWIRGMAARGMSEVQIAEETGLARVTVRRRIGK